MGAERKSEGERSSGEHLDYELYAALVEHAADGIFVTDSTGKYVDVNPAGARLLGRTKSEIVGMHIADIVDPEEIPRQQAVMSNVLAGETHKGEWRLRRADGSFVHVDLSATKLTGGRVQAIVRDLSARKQAEEELRHSEERYQALTRAAYEGIGISEAGKIVDVNEQLATMLGYERSELVGQPVQILIAPESRGVVAAAIGAGTELPYTHNALRKDGSRLIVEVRGRPMNVGGRQMRVVAVRDVTQRQKAQQALESLVRATSKVGTEYFGALARELAHVIGARAAFVADLLREPPGVARIVGLCVDGREYPAFDFELPGSPLGRVIDGTAVSYVTEHALQPRLPGPLSGVDIRSHLGVCLRDAKGEPLGLLVALHDAEIPELALAKLVSSVLAGRAAAEIERMRSDAALRTSEASLRATLAATPYVAVQWYDAAGRVVFWNPASEQMFGYSEAEALGKTLDQLIHTPEEAAAFVDMLREIERTGKAVGPAEYRVRKRDGSYGHCMSTTFRIGNPAGGSRFVCMDVDVTSQKHTEAALREAGERYRLLVESSSDIVAEITSEGRFSYLSPTFERMLGYVGGELLGCYADDNIHPDDRHSLSASGESPAPVTFRYKHRSGAWRWLEATLGTYSMSSGEQRSVVVARDVTARRTAEQEKSAFEAHMQQAQKLEALGTLAGGIAHDFNNILGAITSYAELASLDAHEPQTVVSHLTELRRAADRARDLVQQILTFSRKQRTQRVPVSLAPVITEALRFLRATLPSTVDIKAEVDLKAPMVLAAPIQIHQVLLNLCANAEHAMRGRMGKLRIALDHVTYDSVQATSMSAPGAGSYVRLVVSDNGVGMDEATLEHVFEPFFTTKSPGEGTGLGLAVVHGIVREHGGAISVASATGAGTAFTLLFPAGPAVEPSGPSPVDIERSATRQRIFFVDDEAVLCESSRLVLERMGHEVTVATDPITALEVFRERPDDFDLVITDLTMPRMTGVELARRLLELVPGLPIVLTSGYSNNWSAEDVKALGLRGLLRKPVDMATLAAAVAEMSAQKPER